MLPRSVVGFAGGPKTPDAHAAGAAAAVAHPDCYVRPLYRNAYADWDAAEKLWRHALFATCGDEGARRGGTRMTST